MTRRVMRATPRMNPPAKDARKRKCAIGSCYETLPTNYLMCPQHWRLVTRETQDRVVRACYRYADSDGSAIAREALWDAQHQAVSEVEATLEGASHADQRT